MELTKKNSLLALMCNIRCGGLTRIGSRLTIVLQCTAVCNIVIGRSLLFKRGDHEFTDNRWCGIALSLECLNIDAVTLAPHWSDLCMSSS